MSEGDERAPKRTKLTKGDKGEFLKRVRTIKNSLQKGCKNPLCARKYCRTSDLFEYQNITEQETSRLILRLAKDSTTLFCTDPPFLEVAWSAEKSEKLGNHLDELEKLYSHPLELMEKNFLVEEVPISEEQPSINFKELSLLHENSFDEDAVKVFNSCFQTSLQEFSNGKMLSSLQQLRTVLIFCEHPLLFSYDPDSYDNMQSLLKAFRNMTPTLLNKTLVFWLTTYNPTHLEKLVNITQQFLTTSFLMLYDERNFDIPRHERRKEMESFIRLWLERVGGGLLFLDKIKTANDIYHGEKFDFWRKEKPPVAIEEFYNSAVNETFDFEHIVCDFRKDARITVQKFPWVYDAGTKAKLLEIYQRVQMRHEVIGSVFFGDGQHILVLKIHRENVIQDTFEQLQRSDSNLMRKPLKVKFIGEEGVDEGGVKKEFFQILIRELFDAKYGMFTYNKETDIFWFNSQTFEDPQEFELIGMLLGLAIYNNILLDIRFPKLIFKKLLNKPLTFEDFRDFDPELANGFEKLLEFDGDVEETFCRHFTHEYQFFGMQKVVELKEGGAKIPVTAENRKEYVELYCDYLMHKSIERQYQMLSDGFHTVAGPKVGELFTSNELELLICGSEEVDFEQLESVARYQDGFTKDSKTVKMFWEIAHSLDLNEKRKLLCFFTGSDRIPIRGLKDLVMTISKKWGRSGATSHVPYML